MKTKNLLFLLALGCLSSCQQDEVATTSNLKLEIDNSALTIGNATTRSAIPSNVKTEIKKGDVIALGSTSSSFSSYVVGNEINNVDADNQAELYAHYPAFKDYSVVEKRDIDVTENAEYFFAKGKKENNGQNVKMQFTRKTVPVILVDEQGNPYTGKGEIVLYVRTKGEQDVRNGDITADPKAGLTKITVKRMSEGVTFIIPQDLDLEKAKGTNTIVAKDVKANTRLVNPFGESSRFGGFSGGYKITVKQATTVDWNIDCGIIVDGCTPL